MWKQAPLGLMLLARGAAGHGWMTEPPSRTGAPMEGGGTCPYGSCLWFNQGCTIGCPKCGGTDGAATCGRQQGKATLPQSAKTYDVHKKCGTTPWCAPGSSPVMGPCGVAGGDIIRGKPGNGGDPPPGYKQGFDGTKMPPLKGERWQRTYKQGDVVDMAWSMVANHGGGYQYRLCPKSEAQTEACFQKTPLDFVGDKQYIQYVDYQGSPGPADTPAKNPPENIYKNKVNLKDRVAIPAIRVSEGTVPAGSTWARNPIPACNAAAGGAFNIRCGAGHGTQSTDFQFPPAGTDEKRSPFLLGGFGGGSCGGCAQPLGNNPKFCKKDGPQGPTGQDGPSNCTATQAAQHYFEFNIVDKVRIPKVPPGEYVVSFRWDAEQTPQIWSTCSDVNIVAPDEDDVIV